MTARNFEYYHTRPSRDRREWRTEAATIGSYRPTTPDIGLLALA